MEADFLRFYREDLYQLVFVDKITMRKFMVMIGGLPADSAWQRFLGNKNDYSLPLMLD